MISSLKCSIALAAAALIAPTPVSTHASEKPNIILILADDLGYGDVGCYGARLIKTPNIDRIASMGVRFTTGYSNYAICSPARYCLLAGRYTWRTGRHPETRVMSPSAPLAFEPDRPTIGKMLQSAGYKTAAFGKWHLGFGHEDLFDWSRETIENGPLAAGFDYFFGVSANLVNQPPLYIENDRLWGRKPGGKVVAEKGQGERQQVALDGWKQPEAWSLESANTLFAKKASEFVSENAGSGKPPVFVYYASTIPHGPITPNARYQGESPAGPYGDFIQELDDQVGQILAAFEKAGVLDNTVVIFTSDNGGVTMDRETKGGEAIWAAQQAGHDIVGGLRGRKHSVYEGGARVPFIIRWPGVAPAGAESDRPVSHVDFFATFADGLGLDLPNNGAEDSVSFLSVLKTPGAFAPRDHVINQSALGVRSIRSGQWKYIKPWPVPPAEHLETRRAHQASYLRRETSNEENFEQLYDLESDPKESANVLDRFPEVTERLRGELRAIEERGGTRIPGWNDARDTASDVCAPLSGKGMPKAREAPPAGLIAFEPLPELQAGRSARIRIRHHLPASMGRQPLTVNLSTGSGKDKRRHGRWSFAVEGEGVVEAIVEVPVEIAGQTAALGAFVGENFTQSQGLIQSSPLRVREAEEPAAPAGAAMGRIGIRYDADGSGEFFNTRTGVRFEPYGFNYIVLGNRYPSTQAPSGYHNLFDTEGDNGWAANREIVKRDFADMSARGYNTVRVFLNPYVTGRSGPDAAVNATDPGIDTAYFDNLIECLSIAKGNGLYVTFVVGSIPNPYLPVSGDGPIRQAHTAPAALGTMENKMLTYTDPSLIRAQQRYLKDVLRYLLASGLRDVLFSVEPHQEVGFRMRYSTDGKLAFVPPWGQSRFGPWPANPKDTAIQPSVYDLSPGHPDNWRFYQDVSYYYPEQLTRAIREVEGAEDLLVTFSTGGLVNETRKIVGFDDQAWHQWLYAPALGRLAGKDRHMYVDIHSYPFGFGVPATVDPGPVRAALDRTLFSFGLLDSHAGPERKSAYWKSETIRAPIIIGELGARTPEHPKHPPGGDPALTSPDDGLAALRETVRQARVRGIDGFLFWLYSNERTKTGGAPSCFYNPRQHPEFHRDLAPTARETP